MGSFVEFEMFFQDAEICFELDRLHSQHLSHVAELLSGSLNVKRVTINDLLI